MTVTGAALGDTVVATPTAVASGIETFTLSTARFSYKAWVSAANTVTVQACNEGSSSTNIAAQTWRADVWHH